MTRLFTSLLLLLGLNGCALFTVPPDSTYQVVGSPIVHITSNPETTWNACGHNLSIVGCYKPVLTLTVKEGGGVTESVQYHIYCARGYDKECLHEFLHSAGMNHEQIDQEGFGQGFSLWGARP